MVSEIGWVVVVAYFCGFGFSGFENGAGCNGLKR
jgi:hypothetical protein